MFSTNKERNKISDFNKKLNKAISKSVRIKAPNQTKPPTVYLFVSLKLTLLLHLQMRDYVDAHGFMIDPVARNSLWRVNQLAPVNYNDNELFCGGIGGVTQTGGRCGLCGDPYGMPSPRPHETGGYMATNRTVRNFFPGSTIDVVIDLDTNHGGYFEFELCRRDSFEIRESENCFKKVKFIDGTYKFPLRNDLADRGLKSMSLIIPQDLKECRACILRWNYWAGNNWGTCQNGTQATGCGPQELYRNCADISIGYNIYEQRQKSTLKNKFFLTAEKKERVSIKKTMSALTGQGNKDINQTYQTEQINATGYL